MDKEKQLRHLAEIGDNPSFAHKIEESCKAPITAGGIEILQLNVGKRCNLACKHCHVEAGPHRTELMSKEIFDQCLTILKNHPISTIDITGGAPEMNPHTKWFIEEAAKLNRRLLVRSNLTILQDEKYSHFIDVYTKNRVEIVTSVPDYHQAKTDRQRGTGVFNDVIEVMKKLNNKGYGQKDSGLTLNIVHNPVGAYLPGSQEALEHEYRKNLKDEFGVSFNCLFSLTNVPVGRYLEYLINSGNYEDYMTELCNAYNPTAVDNVMCKSTLSIGWDGTLYDCDFNQMLDIPVNHGAPANIMDFDMEKLEHREIVIHNHCYGCVAGSGSSCQGSTT